MKRSTTRNESSRLRRVHLPGTVPSPAPAALRPRDVDEKRETTDTDTARHVVE
ncbi:hypothetical protein ABZT06_44765 [Streptomyces sp. NPDC005483]|uniref:hypothetical protein n=1 Tax=Streptomyces sp. NPDC005483 TaxID=3154882 RepID=UPI0033AA7A48